MAIDEGYIKAFKETISNKKFRDAKFDIDNEKLFFEAVYLGYLDAARTFKEIGDKKTTALENLAKKMQNYFNSSDENFDILHESWCEKFLNDLQDSQYEQATYGQAQKVVNMAFKYLYCCEGAEKYKDKFANCHMALDSFTLNWYIREVLKVDKNIVDKWSKLDDVAYKKIQTDIRNHLTEKIVIEEEFIIWPDEILIAAALEFNNTFKKIKDCNYPKHENSKVTEVIIDIKDNINS